MKKISHSNVVFYESINWLTSLQQEIISLYFHLQVSRHVFHFEFYGPADYPGPLLYQKFRFRKENFNFSKLLTIL